MCSSAILCRPRPAPTTHARGGKASCCRECGWGKREERAPHLPRVAARERAPALWTHRARESDPVIAACTSLLCPGARRSSSATLLSPTSRAPRCPPWRGRAACPHLAHTTAASLISLSLAARLHPGTPSLSLGSARSLPAARSRTDSALGHTALRYPRASSPIPLNASIIRMKTHTPRIIYWP
ncbi:hypothetical protein C8J57DRAFT_1614306 [Mycena rebaudengoi]|nr:hypothetical protein C8J57DRAFT_1614306 [Mycena rebaudengoi]